MEFRILGPIEVLRNGERVPLGGMKQRALLAILLLNSNRPVSKDELIESLWRESPPPTAPNILQSYISQLRRVLEPDVPKGSPYEVLVTRAPGYAIQVAEDQLDLSRFQILARSGREALNDDPEVAADKLGEALAIWRGPALADFAYEPFAEAHVTRLEEIRMGVLEDRSRAELSLGRHGRVVRELEPVVEENPLRETLRELLMRALYRSGRQAEALNLYQRGRRILVEELGIEPGARLRSLEQAILAQDPDLEWTPPFEPSLGARAPDRLDIAGGEPMVDLETVGQPIPEEHKPSRGMTERESLKMVTVLFAGLNVSNPEDSLDPESLLRIQERCFLRIKTVLERHGGHVQELTGGSVMAVFGVPHVHEDDAVRAVRAALEVRAEVEGVASELPPQWTTAVNAHIGIDTGTVVSTEAPGRPIIGGGPVNIGARLQQFAEPGEILLGRGTLVLARDAVVIEEVSRGSLVCYRVAEALPFDIEPTSRFTSPMVGRVHELTSLRLAFQRCASERFLLLFTILGSAGVGKSRLLRELIAEVEGEARVLRGRCLSYGEGITFWPLVEIIRSALDLEDTDPPSLARERVETLLGSGRDVGLAAERVAGLLSHDDEASGFEEIFWAIRKLLSALAREKPLVVIIDDLQWAEPTLLDLIENVADGSIGAPILLICSARLEFLEQRPNWGGGRMNTSSILLQPLSGTETEELIGNLLGGVDELDRARTKIMEAAEGNPLFVEEIISMLVDDGLLKLDETKWSASDPVVAIQIPPSVEALISARLDYLNADEREVIEAASVVGTVFSRDAVTVLCGGDASRVSGALASLVRKELVRPLSGDSFDDYECRFRHLLVRDAAYDGIPKERRAGLHERYADWLGRNTGERQAELEEILAHHLERAYQLQSALEPTQPRTNELAALAAAHLSSAGLRASARGDMPATVNLLSRALALTPSDAPLHAELLPHHVAALVRTGSFTAAEAVFRDALAMASSTQNRNLEGRILIEQAFMWSQVDPKTKLLEARRSLQHAIEIFERQHDDFGLARAWNLLARIHMVRGQTGTMQKCLESALKRARAANSYQEEIESLSWLAPAAALGPTPVPEVEKTCLLVLEQSRQHPYVEAVTLTYRGSMAAMRGDDNEARSLVEQGSAMLSSLGLKVRLYGWVYWQAFIETQVEDYEAAEAHLRRACEGLQSLGEKNYLAIVSGLLSRTLCIQGRYEEAKVAALASEKVSSPEGLLAQVLWRGARARVLVHEGDLDAAAAVANEVMALSEQIDLVLDKAGALLDVAEVRRAQGNSAEAARLIEGAVDIYRRKGNVPGVRRTQESLAALGSSTR